MPPPVEPRETSLESRARVGLYWLRDARASLRRASEEFAGTDADRNIGRLVAAVTERIGRIESHGLGPIEPPEEEPLAVYVDPVMLAYGVDGGCSPVYVTPEGYPVVPE